MGWPISNYLFTDRFFIYILVCKQTNLFQSASSFMNLLMKVLTSFSRNAASFWLFNFCELDPKIKKTVSPYFTLLLPKRNECCKSSQKLCNFLVKIIWSVSTVPKFCSLNSSLEILRLKVLQVQIDQSKSIPKKNRRVIESNMYLTTREMLEKLNNSKLERWKSFRQVRYASRVDIWVSRHVGLKKFILLRDLNPWFKKTIFKNTLLKCVITRD